MLSLSSIPFNLLMNILTIINSVLFLAIFYGVYYVYSRRDQIIDILKKILKQNINIDTLLSNYYNKNQDQIMNNYP